MEKEPKVYMEGNVPNNVDKYDIFHKEIKSIEEGMESDEVVLHFRYLGYGVVLSREFLAKEGLDDLKAGDSVSIKFEPLSVKRVENTTKYFHLNPETGEKEYLDKRPSSEIGEGE